jgi:molybdopterin-guanine dinucleotide biosynthesis protein A
MTIDNLTAFVLAGGKSSRMGTDKAALDLAGRTLLEHALATLRLVAGTVFILGSKQRYGGYGVDVIEDIFPDCGPLGGIHAALKSNQVGLSLIVAVDTPFLSADFLSYLAKRARESGSVVTTPEIAGYTQPLCAVYSPQFLPLAEEALQRGVYKIAPLFPKDGTLRITESDMAQFAFSAEMFENLNTPQDLERARQRFTEKKA